MAENFQSASGTVGHNWTTNAPDDFDFTSDEAGFFPVSRLRQQYIDYLSTKVLEYEEQKISRHYYHAAQWSPDEIRILRNRRQPVVTFNRTNRKIDSIVGLVQRLRQDPKAFPTNPNSQAGADIVTQSVRAVLDGMDFEYLDFECTKMAAIEGIGGIELKLVEGDHQDPDVSADFVFGEDFFYDPRSRKPDFSDARYMGIAKWLDVEAAVELFPDKESELRTIMVDTGFDLTTHSDQEFKWIYVNEQRLRLVEHWYRYKGKWYWAFYCSWMLLAQGVSPFVDERNQPMNRFVMFSCMVDHDGDRYGFPRNLKGPQDEVNQRRSKALFISNVRRLIMERGAVDDVERARGEWARPDGVIEVNPGRKVEPDDWQPDLQAQLALMQDARSEIDSFANVTPDLMGADDPTRHSGVAINMLQKAGLAELASFIKYYRAWKLRVYRAVWNIIKTTWVNERFVRVNSSNEGVVQMIRLNGQQVDAFGRPQWVNNIGNINVEITLDEGPDMSNVLMDALDQLKNLQPGTVPPQVILKLLPLPQFMRDELNKMFQEAAQKPDPKAAAAQIQAQTAQQRGQAEVAKAKLSAQSEVFNAQQDREARVQDAQNLRQKVELEMRFEEQKHSHKMEELGRQRDLAEAKHSQQMKEAGERPRQTKPQSLPAPPKQKVIPPYARKARDGNHYIPDPHRPGKWLLVA
jgi:hypothetical protein